MNKIAVLGAGTMGAGIAAQFALYGHRVMLYSRSWATLERAEKTAGKIYELLVDTGRMTGAAAARAGEKITCTTSVAEAVKDAWYVVETIVERAAEKAELYEKLDGLLGEDVILTSNTSFMDIFALIPKRRQGNTLIAHWYAPAHILPLVEVVKGPETRPEVVERMLEFHRQCGKTPVLMERYVPGFIVNRIQAAIMREASWMVLNDICSPEDIDNAIKYTHGIRYCFEGPIALWDFAGWTVPVATSVDIDPSLCNDPEPNKLGAKLLEEGYGGILNGKGIFGEYTDPDAFREKRSRRIIQMTKVVEAFDQEDLL